jgi:hypothetical protein
MDPLSITTACLTLLSTVGKTSIAIATFIRGCREARSDLTSISGELTQLHLVLDLLKDDAAVSDDRVIPESLQVQILSIIKNCSAVVDNINTVLDRHSGKSGVVKWVTFGKAEVAGLRMSLEAHRGSLSLVLELVSVSVSRAILDHAHGIRQDTGQIKQDTRQIKQDTSQIPQIMAELDRLRDIVARGEIRSATRGHNFVLEQYLDSLTSYAESVCDDVVWDSNAGSRTPSRKSSQDKLEIQGEVEPSQEAGSRFGSTRPPSSLELLPHRELVEELANLSILGKAPNPCPSASGPVATAAGPQAKKVQTSILIPYFQGGKRISSDRKQRRSRRVVVKPLSREPSPPRDDTTSDPESDEALPAESTDPEPTSRRLVDNDTGRSEGGGQEPAGEDPLSSDFIGDPASYSFSLHAPLSGSAWRGVIVTSELVS